MPVGRDPDHKCRLCVGCGHVFEESTRRRRRRKSSHISPPLVVPNGVAGHRLSHQQRSSSIRSGICPDCQLGKVKCFYCGSVVTHVDNVDAIQCGRKDCKKVFHRDCAEKAGCYITKRAALVCAQHICSACHSYRDSRLWRCCMCPVAYHRSCSPEDTVWIDPRLGLVVCWRHSRELKALGKCDEEGAFNFEEFFEKLPFPQPAEDFQLPPQLLSAFMDESAPPPFFHIKRNVYLVKRPKTAGEDSCCLCTGENEVCGSNCLCRSISTSCSKRCKCDENCLNRPFRKEKKMSIVKTRHCGWGVEAGEDVKAGEFIIEYAGEVIDDALCEKRLWDLKARGAENFYMCEISKNLVIDANFKGNISRYINHSCEPNCQLQKWQVDGETRVGVFASVDIPVGAPLTYDYKFVGYGNIQRCHCGSLKCQGFLNADGFKLKKMPRLAREESLSPGTPSKDQGKKRLFRRDSDESSDCGSQRVSGSSSSAARGLSCAHFARKARKRRHDWGSIRLMLQQINCAVEG